MSFLLHHSDTPANSTLRFYWDQVWLKEQLSIYQNMGDAGLAKSFTERDAGGYEGEGDGEGEEKIRNKRENKSTSWVNNVRFNGCWVKRDAADEWGMRKYLFNFSFFFFLWLDHFFFFFFSSSFYLIQVISFSLQKWIEFPG